MVCEKCQSKLKKLGVSGVFGKDAGMKESKISGAASKKGASKLLGVKSSTAWKKGTGCELRKCRLCKVIVKCYTTIIPSFSADFP